MRVAGLFLGTLLSLFIASKHAEAASLGLTVDPSASYVSTGFVGGSFPSGLFFTDPTGIDGDGTGALAGQTFLDLFLQADILPDGRVGAAGGAFTVISFDPPGTDFLNSGSLLAFGSVFSSTTPDVLEFQFGSIMGDNAGLFSNGALVTLTGNFGDSLSQFLNTIDLFVGGTTLSASITIAPIAGGTPAVIPLPAGLALLLSGLLGFGALRRRAA